MSGPFIALVAASLASVSTPQHQPQTAAAQQGMDTERPPPLKQQGAASFTKDRGCPDTSDPRTSCDVVTARATERQADLMFDSNWLSIFTIVVAGFAAFFAYRAASAGTKSYEAFVAAEDAHLAVEFPNGTLIESAVDGVRQPDTYHLTIKITNIGRSTARLKYCRLNTIDAEEIPIDETLKKEEGTELGWRLQLDSLEPFTLLINYTSPIRNEAVLIVLAQPRIIQTVARVVADVITTTIADFPYVEFA